PPKGQKEEIRMIEWQPIKTLPDDAEFVCFFDAEHGCGCVARSNQYPWPKVPLWWRIFRAMRFVTPKPTHWVKLPALPSRP
ncbi:MAG TPA: hypothetical protein VK652_01045, partial [Steroidobacteraceae bacterium]|nr:hypothetical protein [Steroidobacteraceae bacterium]